MSARARCLAVSLGTTALDVGLFSLCALLLVGPTLLIARWLCGVVGAVANFVGNRVWAFADSRRRREGAQQLWRYALVAAIAVSLATAIWWALGRLTGGDPRLLHLASMALVWVSFTFPLMRRWVFVARQAQGPEAIISARSRLTPHLDRFGRAVGGAISPSAASPARRSRQADERACRWLGTSRCGGECGIHIRPLKGGAR